MLDERCDSFGVTAGDKRENLEAARVADLDAHTDQTQRGRKQGKSEMEFLEQDSETTQTEKLQYGAIGHFIHGLN